MFVISKGAAGIAEISYENVQIAVKVHSPLDPKTRADVNVIIAPHRFGMLLHPHHDRPKALARDILPPHTRRTVAAIPNNLRCNNLDYLRSRLPLLRSFPVRLVYQHRHFDHAHGCGEVRT